MATVEQQVCGNPIACENALCGNPQTQWDVIPPNAPPNNLWGPPEVARDATCGIDPNALDAPCISGFATDISVNRGGTITFKVEAKYPFTNSFVIDIYRLGYYKNGEGARYITTVNHLPNAPDHQDDCHSDETTGLTDCGNWSASAV